MRAEIIAIGDELTSGQRLDTNSQWLSERLGEIGIPVAFHTTVGDDLENNIAVFRTAIERAEIVVATGGLGPTADDLTRDAVAAAAGVELVQDDAALAHIRNLFARRKREMPERNKLQAQFPRGSRVVPNPDGTAPGIDLTVPRSCGPPCRVIALPGVPAEMFAMWNETVAPALTAGQAEKKVICHHRIKCFGVGESDLEAMLPDMIRRKREPLVGITVSGATITLRITTSGPNEAACRKAMAPTVAQIREILGVLVYGEEDDELEHAVVRLLNERGRSVGARDSRGVPAQPVFQCGQPTVSLRYHRPGNLAAIGRQDRRVRGGCGHGRDYIGHGPLPQVAEPERLDSGGRPGRLALYPGQGATVQGRGDRRGLHARHDGYERGGRVGDGERPRFVRDGAAGHA